MENKLPSRMVAYGLAVAAVALATWIRMLLGPLLDDRVPFGVYFLAVIFSAWYGGFGPALVSLVLGILAAAHFIIPPADSLAISRSQDLVSLVIYFLVGLASALLSESQRRSRRRAEIVATENDLLNQRLQDADRRKDEFMAVLAHELRNPLAALRSALSLLEVGGPEVLGQARGVMDRQLHHIERLVDDLLDLSRVRHGKLRLARMQVDLVAVLREALETAWPPVEVQGHELVLSLPAEPIWTEADAVRLTQIVSNLLGNAARYSERPGRIWVTARSEGRQGIISVRDEGIGIAPENLPHVFDLFAQADGSHRSDGLGIGLALVRSLVEMHGGTIVAHSEGSGTGSEFTIRLPALAEAPAARHLHAQAT